MTVTPQRPGRLSLRLVLGLASFIIYALFLTAGAKSSSSKTRSSADYQPSHQEPSPHISILNRSNASISPFVSNSSIPSAAATSNSNSPDAQETLLQASAASPSLTSTEVKIDTVVASSPSLEHGVLPRVTEANGGNGLYAGPSLYIHRLRSGWSDFSSRGSQSDNPAAQVPSASSPAAHSRLVFLASQLLHQLGDSILNASSIAGFTRSRQGGERYDTSAAAGVPLSIAGRRRGSDAVPEIHSNRNASYLGQLHAAYNLTGSLSGFQNSLEKINLGFNTLHNKPTLKLSRLFGVSETNDTAANQSHRAAGAAGGGVTHYLHHWLPQNTEHKTEPSPTASNDVSQRPSWTNIVRFPSLARPDWLKRADKWGYGDSTEISTTKTQVPAMITASPMTASPFTPVVSRTPASRVSTSRQTVRPASPPWVSGPSWKRPKITPQTDPESPNKKATTATVSEPIRRYLVPDMNGLYCAPEQIYQDCVNMCFNEADAEGVPTDTLNPSTSNSPSAAGTPQIDAAMADTTAFWSSATATGFFRCIKDCRLEYLESPLPGCLDPNGKVVPGVEALPSFRLPQANGDPNAPYYPKGVRHPGSFSYAFNRGIHRFFGDHILQHTLVLLGLAVVLSTIILLCIHYSDSIAAFLPYENFVYLQQYVTPVLDAFTHTLREAFPVYRAHRGLSRCGVRRVDSSAQKLSDLAPLTGYARSICAPCYALWPPPPKRVR